jgi:predicted enzyme related to lactoylglutathione lyase
MLTSEPESARDFYAKLLGWSYQELPGIGHIVVVGGNPVGGLWDINSPQTPPGAKPYIGVTIRVDSADATAEKVKSLGGDAKPPFDVMDAGTDGGLLRSHRCRVRRLGGAEESRDVR